MQFDSIEGLLDFAIQNEVEAARFYREMGSRVDSKPMREALEGYAREEDGHKAKLEHIKENKSLNVPSKTVQDLKIGDYLVEEKPTPDMGYQSLLILAMQKEKAAFKLYTDLAALAGDQKLKDALMLLAQEEAKHKLRFELEYDEHFLKEN